jgi:hypothetical protein
MAPKAIEIVVPTLLPVEDVDDDISQVDQNPIPQIVSLRGSSSCGAFQNGIGQSLGVPDGSGAHQDEVVGIVAVSGDLQDSQIDGFVIGRSLRGGERRNSWLDGVTSFGVTGPV